MTRAILFLLAGAAFAQQEPVWQSMFDGQTLQGWKETPFTGKGTVKVQDGCIVLGKGYMTGVNYTGTLPKANYELRMEAQRVEGHDFFAGITFPVNDSFLTWINGGWGGSMIGLSSLDGNDASENETSLSRDFKAGQWYRLWFAVNTEPGAGVDRRRTGDRCSNRQSRGSAAARRNRTFEAVRRGRLRYGGETAQDRVASFAGEVRA